MTQRTLFEQKTLATAKRWGVTGTKDGATRPQILRLRSLMKGLSGPNEFHHGFCVGVDEEVHRMIRNRFPDCEIVAHPSINKHAQSTSISADRYMPALDFIPRNHNIVHAVEFMLVLPKTDEEELRSGTWATYRYTKKYGCPFTVILPDGRIHSR